MKTYNNLADLTILFLTVNKVPKAWAEYQKQVLFEAAREASIITLSKEPLNWGTNVLQVEPESLSNIYWQMLKGAKMATTDYIGIAEDDTLYHVEHFEFRPQPDEFAYNMTHWSLFTWGTPTYSWKDRRGNYSMIAPRKLMIEALEERFAKYPNGTPDHATGELGRERVERNLGVTHRKLVQFWTTIPIINFNHDFSEEKYQRTHVKRMGALRAYEVPHWGRAEELVKHFK